ncbi:MULTISPECIES: class II aldolase/adducin family protein [unclassified Thioalkalivibrio]|uniref:class II aldolase/adducin family protein n=1 Tax=unclassified Thioalkalivibrio TaxID=2621013 RepID=UPI00037DD3A2|nr:MULTISPECIES: class II aldolase/adducin family protein [unclassified Thioalkalivibrio]
MHEYSLPPADATALREAVIRAGLETNRRGLNQGTSGNISVRLGDGMLITPSGVPYEALRPEDLVYVDAAGRWDPQCKPSSEWHFHRAILQARPELGAVVHVHSVYASVVAIQGRDIPALHYMIAAAGGNSIRCAPYATFGTEALSRLAVEALEDRTACLLANHGMIATGPDLERALWLTEEVELLARQYVLSLQIGGPTLLDDAEMDRVLEKFRHYGPQRDAPQ